MRVPRRVDRLVELTERELEGLRDEFGEEAMAGAPAWRVDTPQICVLWVGQRRARSGSAGEVWSSQGR